MVGCRENAKNSLDKNYLYFAKKLGAEIIPETRAVKIQCRGGEYIVETRSSTSFLRNKRKTFRSRGLIIAGGTLGSLELLLKQKYHYKTLPGLSDRLGDALITNSETLNAVSFIPEKTNNGLAITSVFHPDKNTHIEVVKYPEGSNALRCFFTLSAGGSKTIFGRVLKLFGQVIKHPARFIKILFNRPTTAHILGGCPMSQQISQGVVDPELRVHGYPSISLTDLSYREILVLIQVLPFWPWRNMPLTRSRTRKEIKQNRWKI